MKTHEAIFRNQSAPGGVRSFWEFSFPGECKLTKLIVTQTGGPLVAFDIDIFNARVAVAGSQSSGGGDPDGDYAADPHNYKVVPTCHSDAAGKLFKIFDSAEGHFVNADTKSCTNRVKKIYVQIEPEGAGDMTWDITLAGIRDIC